MPMLYLLKQYQNVNLILLKYNFLNTSAFFTLRAAINRSMMPLSWAVLVRRRAFSPWTIFS